jgi:hypothetical protein
MYQHVTRFPSGFDYDFRPESYFDEVDPHTLTVASILGEERRKDVARRLDAGDLDPMVCGEWLFEPKLDDDVRKTIGRAHPAFMGGEYLPGLGENEIEIARVVLASVMQDVTSIRARREGGRILYRVEDEYETVFTSSQTESEKPLTLRELIRLIDGSVNPGDSFGPGLAWPHIFAHIEAGCEDDARNFVSVESAFYPELGSYYACVIRQYFEEIDAERRREDEEYEANLRSAELSAKEPKTGKSGGRR